MNPIVQALAVLDQEPKFLGKLIDNVYDYVTWDTVEYCLNNPQFYPVEMLCDGKKLDIPKHMNCWLPAPINDKRFVFDNVNRGNTFVLLNYSHYNSYTTLLTKELAEKFDVFPDIHVYGGLAGSVSFGIHKDIPPNIIIQAYGETPWKIWKDRNDPPVIDLILKPGEVLYVPGNLYHAAIPSGQRVSMSIPCWPNLNMAGFTKTNRDFYNINYDRLY